jgi:hypothetical protein
VHLAGREHRHSVDLPPDEAIVFKGHPSWRALIIFYAAGVSGALAITVVAARVNGIGSAMLIGAVRVGAILVLGFARRLATQVPRDHAAPPHPAGDAHPARPADADRRTARGRRTRPHAPLRRRGSGVRLVPRSPRERRRGG